MTIEDGEMRGNRRALIWTVGSLLTRPTMPNCSRQTIDLWGCNRPHDGATPHDALSFPLVAAGRRLPPPMRTWSLLFGFPSYSCWHRIDIGRPSRASSLQLSRPCFSFSIVSHTQTHKAEEEDEGEEGDSSSSSRCISIKPAFIHVPSSSTTTMPRGGQGQQKQQKMERNDFPSSFLLSFLRK